MVMFEDYKWAVQFLLILLEKITSWTCLEGSTLKLIPIDKPSFLRSVIYYLIYLLIYFYHRQLKKMEVTSAK